MKRRALSRSGDHNPVYRDFNLDAYLSLHEIRGEAQAFLRAAAAVPSRGPNGYISKTYRYPSQFDGHTITAESGLEFAFYLTECANPEVLRVFEQAPQVAIHGKTAAGGEFVIRPIIDAVVCTKSGVELYEVKTAAQAAYACAKFPNRFQEESAHHYVSRPAADYFGKWGFKHSIVTEHNLSPSFVQWADFLRPYISGVAPEAFTDEEIRAVRGAVADDPGIYMHELPITSDERRAELTYHLLAKRMIFTHFSEGHPAKQKEIRLYPTALQERAFALLRQTSHAAPEDLRDLRYNLCAGSLVELRGREYEVTEIEQDQVHLRTPDGTRTFSFSFAALLDLQPMIGKIQKAEKFFEARVQEASPEDLATMLRRYAIVQAWESGQPIVADGEGIPSERTLRRWAAAMKRKSVALEALLPKRGGNTQSRNHPKADEILQALVEKHYLTADGKSATWIHCQLTNALRAFDATIPVPSYRTVARLCQSINPETRARARKGKRGALAFVPPRKKDLLLGPITPIASFQRAHVDSTEIDLLLKDENHATGKGPKTSQYRLTLCVMTDVYDGRVLAYVATREKPSTETVRMLLTRCVERHRVLPSAIIFDWGTEGKNAWIQSKRVSGCPVDRG